MRHISKSFIAIPLAALLLSGSARASLVSPTLSWDAENFTGGATWVSDPAGTDFTANGGTKMTGATNFAGITEWIDNPDFTQESLHDSLGDGATGQDVTWELVFRPEDLSGTHIIAETGGNGDGTAFRLVDDVLQFIVQDANSATQRVILSDTINSTTDFVHVIATVTLGGGGSNNVVLYVNGTAVISDGATGTIGDWAGSDAFGIGRENGGHANDTGAADPVFDGDIALFNFFQDTVFEQNNVDSHFAAVSVPEPSTFAMMLLGLVGLCWATCRTRVLG